MGKNTVSNFSCLPILHNHVKLNGKFAILTQTNATFSIVNNDLNLSFMLLSVRPSMYSFYSWQKNKCRAFLSYLAASLVFFLVPLPSSPSCFQGQCSPPLRQNSCSRGLQKIISQSCRLPAFANTCWLQEGYVEYIKWNHLQALALLLKHLRIWAAENVSHIFICGEVWSAMCLSP